MLRETLCPYFAVFHIQARIRTRVNILYTETAKHMRTKCWSVSICDQIVRKNWGYFDKWNSFFRPPRPPRGSVGGKSFPVRKCQQKTLPMHIQNLLCRMHNVIVFTQFGDSVICPLKQHHAPSCEATCIRSVFVRISVLMISLTCSTIDRTLAQWVTLSTRASNDNEVVWRWGLSRNNVLSQIHSRRSKSRESMSAKVSCRSRISLACNGLS